MTLEQLRIFVAVAEREHVTQAARALNLTQSAVSTAVGMLEAQYATKLFHRVGRGIELTNAGRLFLIEARAVLARVAAAETVLADLAGLKRGKLALAASQTVANYWLPPLLYRYRQAVPGVEVTLTIGNTEAVAAMVHEGIVDLGFTEGTIEDPILQIIPIAEDEMVLVVSKALAPARRRQLALADIAALPWVFRERGSGTRAIFETALAELGINVAELKIVLELPSNEAVRAAVEAGAGAAALSHLAVRASLEAGTLVTLNLELPKRQFFVIRHKERHVTQAEHELYRTLGAPAKAFAALGTRP
ncbi:MAG: LysR family transcriptional regulator [Methylovirgula sp.]